MGLIANLFGYIFEICNDIVQNYGISIIIFALLIKLITLPLTIKQQKAMKLTQEMQPKLLELQEKYKNNQEVMTLEYQKLMKDNKYNPFGGCLLSIIQVVFLLGVFYVVANPLKYMKKMPQEDIDKYLQNYIIAESFSGDESLFNTEYPNPTVAIEEYKRADRYYELKIIKENSEELDINLNFFGINLGDIASEYKTNFVLLIIPVLTIVFLYLSLYVITGNTKKTQPKMKDAEGNEIEMPNMMALNFIMPLTSGYIAYVVPQGMGLYWFTNSLFQIIIQLGMKKFMEKDSDQKVIEVKKK